MLHNDVRGLQIPVNHSALMGIGYGIRDLAENRQPLAQLRGIQRLSGACPVEVGLERLSPDQLHREEMLSFLRPPGFVNRGNSRMFQTRERLRLAFEQPDLMFVDELASVDHLQRHKPFWPLLLGLVNHPHPAGTEFPDDPVLTDD